MVYGNLNALSQMCADEVTWEDLCYFMSNWDFGSNTAAWSSNQLSILSNIPSLAALVSFLYNSTSNYALSNGQSNWNYASNIAAFASNALSNFAMSNGQSNWNFGSNTAAFASNALSNYAMSNGQSNWNYASNTAAWDSNNFSNYASSNGQSNWNYASNTAAWDSNNFSNYAPSNGQSNWHYASNTAVWDSNNFSNYAPSNGQSNWNYASNTAVWDSNNFSNYAPSNGQSNWNFGSNTANWTSNALSNFSNAASNWNYASNTAVWDSNNFSNYAPSNGQSNWNFGSNTANWTSNALSNFSNAASNWNYASNTAAWDSNNFSNYAPSNGQSNWNYASNTAAWDSNNFSNYAPSNGQSNWNYASNTAVWDSNNFSNYAPSNGQSNWNYGSNTANWTSNQLIALSNHVMMCCDKTMWTSNALSNYAPLAGVSNWNYASNLASWTCNQLVMLSNIPDLFNFASNTSNAATWAGKVIMAFSNTFCNFYELSNVVGWTSNNISPLWVNVNIAQVTASNALATSTWLSNNLPNWSNVTTDPFATGNAVSTYGTFTFNTTNSNVFYIDYTGRAVKVTSAATVGTGTVPTIVGVTSDPTAAGNSASLYGKVTVNSLNSNVYYVDDTGASTLLYSPYSSNVSTWLSNNLANWSNVTTDPLATGNSSNLYGTFTYNTATSNIYYVDYSGAAKQVSGPYASNTAAWLSNNLAIWSNVTTDPLISGNPSNMYGTFTFNTSNCNMYYVDYNGGARKIDSPYASNLATWLSNQLVIWSNMTVDPPATGNTSNYYGLMTFNTTNSNMWYIDYNGVAKKIDSPYASNLATWLSNQLVIWSNMTVDPPATGNTSNYYGLMTFNTTNSNMWYIDYNGVAKKIDSPYASNLATWLSNQLVAWSNVTTDPTLLGNSSNLYGMMTYNTSNSNMFYVDYNGVARRLESPYASNLATWLSNQLVIWSNMTVDPPATGNTSNYYGLMTFNTTNSNMWYIDYNGVAKKIDSPYASNLSTWLSNQLVLWSNVTTNPAATGNAATAYGTFTFNTANSNVFYIDYTGKALPINNDYWTSRSNAEFTYSNVGINTSNPEYDLDVAGVIQTEQLIVYEPTVGTSNRSYIQIINNSNPTEYAVIGSAVGTGSWGFGTRTNDLVISQVSETAGVWIGTSCNLGLGGPNGLYVNCNNYVGVQTQNPRTPLTVVYGEVSTASNEHSYRMVNSTGLGNHGAFWRNDGSAIYLMGTSNNDPWGNFNGYRPFQANLANGTVSIGGGGTTLPPALYVEDRIIGGFVGLGMYAPLYRLHLATDSAGKPSSTTWTVVSDERLKEQIELADIDICYSNVKNIPLKYYKWRDDIYSSDVTPDRHKLGWIAQDVEKVFPKAVSQKKMHGYEDCRDLNADQLYATMYGAIQKLQSVAEEGTRKAADQQRTIDALKQKVDELVARSTTA